MRAALHKATADSSRSQASSDTTSSRDVIAMSASCSAGVICSVAASDSAPEPLDHSSGASPGSCIVASVSVCVAGVCSVARLVAVVRFPGVGFFPKVGRKKAMAVQAQSIRRACIDIAVKIRHCNC